MLVHFFFHSKKIMLMQNGAQLGQRIFKMTKKIQNTIEQHNTYLDTIFRGFVQYIGCLCLTIRTQVWATGSIIATTMINDIGKNIWILRKSYMGSTHLGKLLMRLFFKMMPICADFLHQSVSIHCFVLGKVSGNLQLREFFAAKILFFSLSKLVQKFDANFSNNTLLQYHYLLTPKCSCWCPLLYDTNCIYVACIDSKLHRCV